ncbi:hypothetical protein GLYMA_19G018250v4 [Glycine max]|nr:hypothetical protein GLYMA_19G018250v4 [Glycine max]KAH1076000.1 hypothetical protein GYH30_051749 [Glycine max]
MLLGGGLFSLLKTTWLKFLYCIPNYKSPKSLHRYDRRSQTNKAHYVVRSEDNYLKQKI